MMLKALLEILYIAIPATCAKHMAAIGLKRVFKVYASSNFDVEK